MQKPQFNYSLYVAMAYVTTILVSNVIAYKIIKIGPFDLPAAVIVYPLIFILDDILAEVYGYRYTRPIIWFSLLCSAMQMGFFQLSIVMPSITQWHHQFAYETVLGTMPRIVVAAFIAIACAQFANAYLIAKLKMKTQGKYLGGRLVFSTFIGVSIDSVLFIMIAFLGVLPLTVLGVMIGSQIVIKVGYEIMLLPFITWIIHRLKHYEGIDYYDTNTNFNPFARH